MAEAKTKITVSVEKFIHDALRAFAQSVLDDHGICIHNANFKWHENQTIGKQKSILSEIQLDTSTKI